MDVPPRADRPRSPGGPPAERRLDPRDAGLAVGPHARPLHRPRLVLPRLRQGPDRRRRLRHHQAGIRSWPRWSSGSRSTARPRTSPATGPPPGIRSRSWPRSSRTSPSPGTAIRWRARACGPACTLWPATSTGSPSPKHGRYVGHPAIADASGVVSVPPDTSDPTQRLLLGFGIGAVAGLAIAGLVAPPRVGAADERRVVVLGDVRDQRDPARADDRGPARPGSR